jgi:hypothetical protein
MQQEFFLMFCSNGTCRYNPVGQCFVDKSGMLDGSMCRYFSSYCHPRLVHKIMCLCVCVCVCVMCCSPSDFIEWLS